jgi:glycerol uptake facilitator-like aquaporin
MSLKETIRNSILILLFEFIGTTLLTLLLITLSISMTLNISDLDHPTYSPSSDAGEPLIYANFLLGYWILLIFSSKVSGSHFNPAITLAFMLRRDAGRFSKPLGFGYIIFQVAGAFAGALLNLLFT